MTLVTTIVAVGASSEAAPAAASRPVVPSPVLVAQTGDPNTSAAPPSSSASAQPSATSTTTQGAVGSSVTPGSSLSASSALPTAPERRRVARLRRCLRVLQPIDRRALSLRYGLGRGDPAGMDVIAQRLGLSIAHVGRIERRALASLRRAAAAGPRCGEPVPAAASPTGSTTSRPAEPDASAAAKSSNSPSRHYVGLILLIAGLGGLAGVLVYTTREIRRSL